MNALCEEPTQADSANSPTDIMSGDNIKMLPLVPLLALIAGPETNHAMADLAQKEFHRRFYHRIKGLWKTWKAFGSRYDMDIFTNETFKRFYETVGTLKWPEVMSPQLIEDFV